MKRAQIIDDDGDFYLRFNTIEAARTVRKLADDCVRFYEREFPSRLIPINEDE